MESETILAGNANNASMFVGNIRTSAQLGDTMPTPDAQDTGCQKIRHIEIDQLNYGYIITVGCHKFAIEDQAKAANLIEQYMKNPSDIESKWFKGELFKS